MSSLSSTTTSPATEALENFLGNSNKRVKRSTMDSPSASAFSFEMSELFNQTSEEAFPSIAWSLDNVEDDDDDDKSVSSTCSKSSSMTSCMSDSSLLGKRSRTTSSSVAGGLTRSKTLRSSIDLLG